jgi:hypothetical protein
VETLRPFRAGVLNKGDDPRADYYSDQPRSANAARARCNSRVAPLLMASDQRIELTADSVELPADSVAIIGPA